MRATTFEPVAHQSVERAPAGVTASSWMPGDILLTHGHALFSRMIQIGQRLRIHGDDRRYTWFTHAALVVGENGELVEVTRPGVRHADASKYHSRDYVVVHTGTRPDDVEEIRAFVDHALATRAAYGVTTIVSIVLTLLTGAKFAFFIDGEFICSGFVARAMERAGAVFSRDPVHITPADLAKYYDVVPPA